MTIFGEWCIRIVGTIFLVICAKGLLKYWDLLKSLSLIINICLVAILVLLFVWLWWRIDDNKNQKN